MSDPMVDQLSMNFGQVKKRVKQESNYQESVASVITKGGTVVNPFNLKKSTHVGSGYLRDNKFVSRRGRGRSKESLSPLGEINDGQLMKKAS